MPKKKKKVSIEFKKQVALYEGGKCRHDIAHEYDLTPSVVDRWITQFNQLLSFSIKKIRILTSGKFGKIMDKIIRYLW